MRALNGVRVIELGQIYNGPYCGLLLAKLGAEVIKVEPPSGEMLRFRSHHDEETHEFTMLNSNKESLVIDLKSPDGKELFRRLLGEVDVLIENFAPGTMEKLGLEPHSLVAQNPRLVVASGKGYGSNGPYSHMAAMDITVQAMSGAMATTGEPDASPMKAGPAFVDMSGGVHLYGAIMAALFQRERTGQGQVVEVSMHDTVYPMLASSLGGLHNDATRKIPERTGNRHSGLAVSPYNVYETSDGWVAIIAPKDKHFHAVLRSAGLVHLADDPRFIDRIDRAKNMDDLDHELSKWTRTLTRDGLVSELQSNGVPCAPVLTIREVDQDVHLIERGMIQHIDHPTRGRVPVAGSPLHLSGSPMVPAQRAPQLGEHSEAVLQRFLGMEHTEIDALRSSGAVR